MDQGMLRKMQKMQKELEAKTEEFMQKSFSLEKHGIFIEARGDKKITSIKIKDDFLLDPEDAETLEDLLVLVINDLFREIDEQQEAMMPNIPGLGF